VRGALKVIFTELEIPGVWLIRQERRADGRGYFARTFCAEEFAAHGLPTLFPQCNISFNTTAGTLRGLHWQDDPCQEGKLVRCSAGRIFDVAVDLRPRSPTRGRWVAAALSAADGDALYIPPHFAHGFQTLQDHSEVFYHMTEPYRDGFARGYRWDSPALAITWPAENPILSERDAALPLFA
jgi:dTDP-4-dehydrorhamnose 3,5-epimerase